MISHHYFDVQLKFQKKDSVVLTPIYFRGCVLSSLEGLFGEIRGKTPLDIIKFSAEHQRVVFRVPEDFAERTRIGITLIGAYQEVPCHFRVLTTSKTPLDFEGDCDEIGKDVNENGILIL